MQSQAPVVPPKDAVAQHIKNIEQANRVLSARAQAATGAISELTDLNVGLRATTILLENQCREMQATIDALKISESPDTHVQDLYAEINRLTALVVPNDEIERLNRVVEALDRQLATFVQENEAQACHIASLEQQLKDANDGA